MCIRDRDSAKITVIATGLNDATAKQASVSKVSAVPAQPDVYKRQLLLNLFFQFRYMGNDSHQPAASGESLEDTDCLFPGVFIQ